MRGNDVRAHQQKGSQESILEHFDVTVISRYCPEFEQELPSYLSQS
jgi:hypothetical protein